MSTPTLWLSQEVHQLIIQDADRMWPMETGGVLAGYIADNQDVVVLSACGPGPNAKHGRYRFKPDDQFHTNYLEELYRRSHARSYYLGDWHTHPGASPEMSYMDRRTLMRIAHHADASLESPLMMILGDGGGGLWNALVHQYRRDSLFALCSVSSSIPFRIFNPENVSENRGT